MGEGVYKSSRVEDGLENPAFRKCFYLGHKKLKYKKYNLYQISNHSFIKAALIV